jgi:hypothetical protein
MTPVEIATGGASNAVSSSCELDEDDGDWTGAGEASAALDGSGG